MRDERRRREKGRRKGDDENERGRDGETRGNTKA